jgi:hypothetical protein
VRATEKTRRTAVGGAIFVLELWLLFEAVAAVRRLLAARREVAFPLGPTEASPE